MHPAIFSLCASIFFFCVSAAASPEYRAKYTPYPEDGYPQIIQKDDYSAITFIEALYKHLLDVPAGKGGSEEFGRAASCEITRKGVTFLSQKNAFVLHASDKNTVLIDKERFTSPSAVILYSTLLRLLNDFAEKSKCHEARFVQYGTKSYKTRTIIEFDFGAEVVQLDSLSNGPKNEERLYILDVVERKESMFWSRQSVRAQ